MSNLVDNERTKLLANALDRGSTACFAVGVIAPVVGVGTSAQAGNLILGAVIWLSVGVVLHMVARMILGRLRQ